MNDNSFFKSILTSGLYLGTAMVIFNAVIYLADAQGNAALGWLSYVLVAVGILIAQIKYRDNCLGGTVLYRISFAYGVYVTMCASVFLAVWRIILIHSDPSLLEQSRAIVEAAMLQSKFPDDKIEDAVSQTMRLMQNPLAVTLSTTFMYGLTGMLFSSITSAFVSRGGQVPPSTGIKNQQEI
ncbi:MAG: DUF4199 family protein [Bacteroidales bacterium]|nr:DUF4199 family protein [Bacteroidales bacterium]